MCCNTPPLVEVLKLWDFFFAFGVHLVVPCVVAQVILNREMLLKSERSASALPSSNPRPNLIHLCSVSLISPLSLLRTLQPLKARPIINKCLAIIKEIPQPLYESLVRHPLDPPQA